jgi:predicted ATPase/DNA-binding SARP family transcriptional activator/DNA-binding CsgD family transcriptional regulator/Tfp pilus assembly protein PilF
MPNTPPVAGPPPLRIQVLADFRVWVGARALAASAWPRKAAHLVKLLAITPGHRLHREQVLEHLWPDFDPPAAANNLHRALHAARRLLEPDRPRGAPSAYLRLQGDALALSPAAAPWTDVAAFEAAAADAHRRVDAARGWEAEALYAGDLLPEDAYEDWVAGRREALRRTYLTLLLALAGWEEARGEPARAVMALERLVAAEPAHEAAHRRLMRLYALAGRRAAALRQYQALVEALRRELDAEPDADSRELYAAILAGQRPAVAGAPGGAATNLPPAADRFIGRAHELVEVLRRLERSRLLTLTGAGGCGKTRLALAAAERARPLYPDGVWWVELAALADPRLVPAAVAAALGVDGQHDEPLRQTLARALGPKRLLLVLDNCEHVVAACRQLLDHLLTACPDLHVLATSRTALGLPAEVTWRVPSLAMPDPARSLPLERLAAFDAVQLFVERARSARSDFALTPRNAAAIARICRRLDGIPLALELAAARAKVLSAEQIAARLDDALGFLTGGARPVPDRQQTLRATLDYSWALLTGPERTLFRRLAAFAGGWAPEAAERVCADEPGEPAARHGAAPTPPAAAGRPGGALAAAAVLDLLARLEDQSLIVVQERHGQARHRLLEPVRQYAAEQLAAAGEAAWLRDRHAAYFLALAEQAEPALVGAEQSTWLERLEAEHDNLRAALAWALERPDPDLGVRLAGALWRFWYQRGRLSEGDGWLAQVLAIGPAAAPAARAKALNGAGTLAFVRGDSARAVARYEQALALRRALADTAGVAGSLNNLGMVLHYRGEYARALPLYSEALALSRALGDRRLTAITLNNLGTTARAQGDFARAAAAIEEALALFSALGDRRSVADLRNNLGQVAYARGDYARACELCGESLALFRELDDRPGVNEALQQLGLAALALGDAAQAAARLEEALALSRELGDTWGIAAALDGLGQVAYQRGDDARAVALGQESLALHRELGYRRGSAASLANLARAAARQGRPAAALAQYREALAIYHELADQAGVAACLAGIGGILAGQGQLRRAVGLFGAAAARQAAAGAPPVRPAEYEPALATARARLGPAAATAAWAAGAAAAPEQAVAWAMTEAVLDAEDGTGALAADSAPAAGGPAPLTQRERAVALLVAQGMTNRQIAGELGMAVRTVDTHVTRILHKLGLRTRAHVADWAGARGLLRGGRAGDGQRRAGPAGGAADQAGTAGVTADSRP